MNQDDKKMLIRERDDIKLAIEELNYNLGNDRNNKRLKSLLEEKKKRLATVLEKISESELYIATPKYNNVIYSSTDYYYAETLEKDEQFTIEL